MQSLANTQAICPSNDKDEILKLQIELCEEKTKNRRLKTELCLLTNKRIGQVEELMNKVNLLEAKLSTVGDPNKRNLKDDEISADD